MRVAAAQAHKMRVDLRATLLRERLKPWRKPQLETLESNHLRPRDRQAPVTV
jgi:hypothetical protein